MSSNKTFPRSAESYSRITFWNSLGGIEAGGNSVPVQKFWTDSVTYGDNLPGWRQLLRDGMSATTSLAGNRMTVRIQPGSLRFRPDPSGQPQLRALIEGTCGMIIASPTDPELQDEAKANAEALGRFAKRIIDAQTAVKGGVVIGELGQTLRMIRNPALGLRRLVDDGAKILRDIRAARRLTSLSAHKKQIAQNLADAWLELSFGWRPLLADVKDGCSALDQYRSGQGLSTKRITSSGQASETLAETIVTTQNSYCVWAHSSRWVASHQVIYRGAVRLEARAPGQMDPKLFGFSPEQFLPTAWELLPWSFLIDYFVNVDEIIAGWSTLFARLAWSNKTVRKSAQRTQRAYSDKQLTEAYESGVPCTIVTEQTNVSRAKYEGGYTPDLTFEIPSIGSMRWLNIAALIASRQGDRSWSYD